MAKKDGRYKGSKIERAVMVKNTYILFFVFLVTVCIHPVYASVESNVILDLLIKKGLVSLEEVESAKNEIEQKSRKIKEQDHQ